MEDPSNEEKKKAVEEAKAKLAARNDYVTFKDMGEEKPEYLKAMDFMDVLTPKIRYFNVCRAKTGARGNVRKCAETCEIPRRPVGDQQGARDDSQRLGKAAHEDRRERPR
eukprot:1295044-Lingulodinium_polyedra.AAC.1